MNNYIQLTDAQKQIVLTQCKNKLGLPEQAVEKDYWVTVMLQLIFDSELNDYIIFKGLCEAIHNPLNSEQASRLCNPDCNPQNQRQKSANLSLLSDIPLQIFEL